MYMKNPVFLLIIVVVAAFVTTSLIAQEIPEKWNAPEEYQSLKNPFDADGEALSNGKMLYNMHCRLCHGKKGLGDGSGGKDLETKVQDLNSEAIITQPEGVLFYKITTGRKDMPEYLNKIPEEEDRWNLVSYLQKTFGN